MSACETCGHTVALDAKKCPNCGGKTGYGKLESKVLFALVALVLVIAAFFVYNYVDNQRAKDADRKVCEEFGPTIGGGEEC